LLMRTHVVLGAAGGTSGMGGTCVLVSVVVVPGWGVGVRVGVGCDALPAR
jgi:hypothetical protein